MTITTKEKDTLLAILQTEITEVEDLIATADEVDKAELVTHLETVKSIYNKIA